MTFLIIKINENDVGARDLADPLYRLPSECVTVTINNLEQIRMRIVIQRWPNLSCAHQIIKWWPPDINCDRERKRDRDREKESECLLV